MKYVFMAMALLWAGAAGAQGTRYDTAWFNQHLRFEITATPGLGMDNDLAYLKIAFRNTTPPKTLDLTMVLQETRRSGAETTYIYTVSDEDRPALLRALERQMRIGDVGPAVNLCRTPQFGNAESIKYNIFFPANATNRRHEMGPEKMSALYPRLDPCPTPR